MKKIYLSLLIVCCLFTSKLIAADDLKTPYPTVIELKQINGAEKERIRLAQGHKKFEQQPTGFYVEKGKRVVVNVEILTPAVDGKLPVLSIGTLGFNVDGRTRNDIALNPGINTISASQHNEIGRAHV